MADISQITLPDGNTYDIKDANATTKSYVDARLASKQDTLTAGTGINIDSNNIISVTGGGGAITDVQVDGVSVVTSGVAEIDLTPYVETSDLATVATSGSYTDLSNNPTNATQSVSGLMSSTDKTKLDGIANGAEVNVQSDYRQNDTTADDYIKNKPYLGTAAAKNYTDSMTSGASGDLPTKSAVASALAGYVPAALIDQYINIDEGQYDGTFDVYYNDGTTIFHDIVPFGNATNFIRHGGTLKGTADEYVDLNIYTGTDARHIFWVEVNQYTDNAPVGNGNFGNLECFGSMQRFSRYKQAGSGECYQRHYVNHTWSPWMRINQDIHTLVTDDMTTAVTLTSGSYGTLASVTLAKGIWQLNARASFTANATGNRAIIMTNSSTSTSSYDSMYVRVPSAGGSHTTGLCVSGCFELAQQTTLYLRGFQNSGGNLNASSASIRAIRIA